jgi:hypothetical protein
MKEDRIISSSGTYNSTVGYIPAGSLQKNSQTAMGQERARALMKRKTVQAKRRTPVDGCIDIEQSLGQDC